MIYNALLLRKKFHRHYVSLKQTWQRVIAVGTAGTEMIKLCLHPWRKTSWSGGKVLPTPSVACSALWEERRDIPRQPCCFTASCASWPMHITVRQILLLSAFFLVFMDFSSCLYDQRSPIKKFYVYQRWVNIWWCHLPLQIFSIKNWVI